MKFWLIISATLVAICIGAVIFRAVKNEKDINFWFSWQDNFCIGLSIVTGAIAMLMLALVCATRLDYAAFEKKFEIQRNQYEAIVQSGVTNETNMVYVADIIEWNNTLATYQANHEYFGVVSVIPDRVMDIDPIGLR